jgi:hypothetical protein
VGVCATSGEGVTKLNVLRLEEVLDDVSGVDAVEAFFCQVLLRVVD